MDIITQNAEELLYEDLSAASGFMPDLRCIHFKRAPQDRSSTNAQNAMADGASSAFINELKGYLGQMDARIFLCHDGDVFVVAPDLTQHNLNGFLHHLEAKLGPASFMGLAYLFEVGVDWSKLRVLCERKFQSLRRAGAIEVNYLTA